MRKMLAILLILGLFLPSVSPAAQFMSVNDWTYRDDIGDVGIPLFQVTMTFTPAADLGGTDNKYEYSVENLTDDLTARLFRVANPDNLTRTMSGPVGWNERIGSQNFVWEDGSIAPGETVGIFEVLTPGLLPDLVTPPFDLDGRGWIETEDPAGSRVDVLGPIIHVPEPVTLAVLALGLLPVLLRKRTK